MDGHPIPRPGISCGPKKIVAMAAVSNTSRVMFSVQRKPLPDHAGATASKILMTRGAARRRTTTGWTSRPKIIIRAPSQRYQGPRDRKNSAQTCCVRQVVRRNRERRVTTALIRVHHLAKIAAPRSRSHAAPDECQSSTSIDSTHKTSAAQPKCQDRS